MKKRKGLANKVREKRGKKSYENPYPREKFRRGEIEK